MFPLPSRFFVSVACLVAGAVLGSWPERAMCDDSASVNIFVRAIQASEPIKGEPSAASELQAPRVAPELADISAKLGQLPFSSFTLLSTKNESHVIKRRETMKLPNGQSLTFRPMYMDNKRVGLWLNWREADGSEILNTRVHFDSDDTVVTGTDCAGDKGLILAIKAVPLPTPEAAAGK